MFDKFKSFLANDTAFYSCLLVFLAISSFALGRLSILVVKTEVTPTISYTETNEVVRDLENSPVVASKNGSKYHYLWCSGAVQMKAENKLEFANASAAEAAGYQLATNCES